MMRPDLVVSRAAENRRRHYQAAGTVPLDWGRLTDAQKVPWILQAAKEIGA